MQSNEIFLWCEYFCFKLFLPKYLIWRLTKLGIMLKGFRFFCKEFLYFVWNSIKIIIYLCQWPLFVLNYLFQVKENLLFVVNWDWLGFPHPDISESFISSAHSLFAHWLRKDSQKAISGCKTCGLAHLLLLECGLSVTLPDSSVVQICLFAIPLRCSPENEHQVYTQRLGCGHHSEKQSQLLRQASVSCQCFHGRFQGMLHQTLCDFTHTYSSNS